MNTRSTRGAETLKSMRRAAGLTQEQLAIESGLHVRTIRGLETGQITSPRRTSLARLADALRLDVAQRENMLSAWSVIEHSPLSQATAKFGTRESANVTLESLIQANLEEIRIVATSESVEVGANRLILSRSSEDVVIPLHGSAVRWLLLQPDDPMIELSRIVSVPIENCSLGRELVFDDQGVRAVELILDPDRPEGETHRLRYRIGYRQAYKDGWEHAEPVSCVYVGFFRQVNSCMLQVRFDENALPRVCRQAFVGRPGSTARMMKRTELDAAHSIHLVVPSPTPGAYGLAWDW